MSVTFQRSFGPSFGHCLSKPVSWETPSRCGPRHCGQSVATRDSAVDTRTKPARITNKDFILADNCWQLFFVRARASKLFRINNRAGSRTFTIVGADVRRLTFSGTVRSEPSYVGSYNS